jgi:ribosomal protein L22
MPEIVKAYARNVHMSSRKVRRILEPLRGMEAQQAIILLREMPHAAAVPCTSRI